MNFSFCQDILRPDNRIAFAFDWLNYIQHFCRLIFFTSYIWLIENFRVTTGKPKTVINDEGQTSLPQSKLQTSISTFFPSQLKNYDLSSINNESSTMLFNSFLSTWNKLIIFDVIGFMLMKKLTRSNCKLYWV